jgi:hypothetical protein
MPKSYPAEFRREMRKRMREDELVSKLARETGVCEATLFLWKKQALIDSGQIQGTGLGRPGLAGGSVHLIPTVWLACLAWWLASNSAGGIWAR